MAFRNLTRNLFQLVKTQKIYTSIQQHNRKSLLNNQQFRLFSSIQTNNDAYKDLNSFLEKEVQLEKQTQKHPNKLPKISGFEIQNNGPDVTLTRQIGNDKVSVKFNVTNTVGANESDQETDLNLAAQQQLKEDLSQSSSTQLKSRPTFTVDINRNGQILSFLCSYLPQDHQNLAEQYGAGETQQQEKNQSEQFEDFQIDEFAIHDGEWNDKVYSADCAVIDGELYDKLLNLLEQNGIGEEFANQLTDFSTAYEHHQYIGLLEKLQKFTKK